MHAILNLCIARHASSLAIAWAAAGCITLTSLPYAIACCAAVTKVVVLALGSVQVLWSPDCTVAQATSMHNSSVDLPCAWSSRLEASRDDVCRQ